MGGPFALGSAQELAAVMVWYRALMTAYLRDERRVDAWVKAVPAVVVLTLYQETRDEIGTC